MPTRAPASPKSDFIRSLPPSLSVAEVVARAAAAGMALSGSMVRKTRADASGKSQATRPKAAPARASAGTSGAVKARPGSKRAFVLTFASDTPASEIVAAGKSKGLSFPPNYVHWVRSDVARKEREARGKGGGGATSAATPAGAQTSARRPEPKSNARPATPARPRQGSAADSRTEGERALLHTALRVVGIERAIELLESARSRLDLLLGD